MTNPPTAQDDGDRSVEHEMAYYAVSGFGERFSFLAMRYDGATGFRPAYGETFVGEVEPDPKTVFRFATHHMLRGLFTGLWRSAEDRVWVTESSGRVFAFANPKCEGLVTHKLVGSLLGIWGIDDRHVLAWGENDTTPVMYRWNGTKWSGIASPPFKVTSVHGSGPNDIWAVGNDARLAHWTGKSWQAIQAQVDEELVSIFVAAADEIYACGNAGSVFEGSGSGLTRIGRIPGAQIGDVTAVGKWNDALWIAANRLGTWRRLGTTSKFECVKSDFDAVSFDVRHDMVLACRRFLAHTRDGKSWNGTAFDFILQMRGDTPLGGKYP